MAVYKSSASGGDALNLSRVVPTGKTYQLVSVSVNLNAAPTTAGNLTITLDADAGPECDTLLYSLDMAAGGTTDVFWWPDQPTYIWGGDAVTVAYANPNGKTYGAQITVREA